MPDPISSVNQSLIYTPADPEEVEGGTCVDPEPALTWRSDAPPSFQTTHGDGELHVEGWGFRVDPSASSTGSFDVNGYNLDVTLSGVDALVAATDNNADGSKGARLAASANVFQGTATVSNGTGGEVTVGVGVGAGVDVSSGTRDADGDGHDEYCLRVAVGFAVAGICTEAIPAFVEDVGEGLTR